MRGILKCAQCEVLAIKNCSFQILFGIDSRKDFSRSIIVYRIIITLYQRSKNVDTSKRNGFALNGTLEYKTKL